MIDAAHFSQIVCTPDVLWGQPRLEGRRLSVGDVVSIVDGCSSLSSVLSDFELSAGQVRQALDYCKRLACKEDAALRYCHNCRLRVEQDGGEFDEEDPEQDNWIRAERLLKTYF